MTFGRDKLLVYKQ